MPFHRVVVRFSKEGRMRYISHLDMVRLFSRCLRRAEIPAFLTEGFNPHPKISFERALKLGAESKQEKAAFRLRSFMAPPEFKRRMNGVLPEGIRIEEAGSAVAG